jgi:hypothetical protein
MLGIVVFIHALISYIKTYLGGVSWNIYIPGKNTQVTEHSENIGIPALSEPARQKPIKGKSLETGFDGRRKYCIRAFNQDKKPAFFGTDASWTGGAAIFGAPND